MQLNLKPIQIINKNIKNTPVNGVPMLFMKTFTHYQNKWQNNK